LRLWLFSALRARTGIDDRKAKTADKASDARREAGTAGADVRDVSKVKADVRAATTVAAPGAVRKAGTGKAKVEADALNKEMALAVDKETSEVEDKSAGDPGQTILRVVVAAMPAVPAVAPLVILETLAEALHQAPEAPVAGAKATILGIESVAVVCLTATATLLRKSFAIRGLSRQRRCSEKIAKHQ